jgi:hypothetical protein
MTIKLTWPDLIDEGFSREDLSRSLALWSWLLPGDEVGPIFLSRFGDWFLRRRDGSTLKLDVLAGEVVPIADTPEEFQSCVNSQEWQEEHLYSLLIYELHESGKIAAKGQCYAVTPHPVFGGRLEPEFIMVIDRDIWQSICVQSFRPVEDPKMPKKPWWRFGR